MFFLKIPRIAKFVTCINWHPRRDWAILSIANRPNNAFAAASNFKLEIEDVTTKTTQVQFVKIASSIFTTKTSLLKHYDILMVFIWLNAQIYWTRIHESNFNSFAFAGFEGWSEVGVKFCKCNIYVLFILTSSIGSLENLQNYFSWWKIAINAEIFCSLSKNIFVNNHKKYKNNIIITHDFANFALVTT